MGFCLFAANSFVTLIFRLSQNRVLGFVKLLSKKVPFHASPRPNRPTAENIDPGSVVLVSVVGISSATSPGPSPTAKTTSGYDLPAISQGSYFYGALHADIWSWSIVLPCSLRGPPVASCLKGAGPIPQVGLGRAAVSAFYQNQEIWTCEMCTSCHSKEVSTFQAGSTAEPVN